MIQTSMKSDDDFFTFHETEPESVACNALAEMEMFLTDGSKDQDGVTAQVFTYQESVHKQLNHPVQPLNVI
jgi:hypothetical protein